MIKTITLLDSPESYYLTEMTSVNNGRDEKGYYICTNVVAARTGVQKYLGKELGVTDSSMLNDIFYLERDASEVFSKKTLASFNGAAFTDGHPTEKRVTSKNSKFLSKGIVTNPRKADFLDAEGNELLLVDIIVSDEDLITKIENGQKQVSAGYSWDYEVIDLKARRLKVKNIRANHVASVPRGRAGSAMILDEEIVIIKELVLDEKGGKADNMTPEEIAKKHSVTVDSITNQLTIGIKVEMEHTDNEALAREIASDHLFEIPDYYTRLQKMEEDAKKELKDGIKELKVIKGGETMADDKVFKFSLKDSKEHIEIRGYDTQKEAEVVAKEYFEQKNKEEK